MSGVAFGLVKVGYKMNISREMLFPSTRPELTKIETPKTAEWLERRDQFVAYYEEVAKAGVREGFLENVACYECGGELIETTNVTDVTWEDAK